jgi:DNA-binding transcriptional MerR regulator
VTLLHISELAERSGVPSSTLRYYERIGLVRPCGRARNGYRLYDSTAVDRLAFIGRAKRLGMSLEEVAALVDAWVAGDCEPVQEQLRAFVAGRLAALRDHITEDVVFEGQLQRILSRLDQIRPLAGGCGPDCGCDTDPVPTADATAACSLTPADVHIRLDQWRHVWARATRLERHPNHTVAAFDPSPELAGELGRLCAEETGCCPGFRFSLHVAASGLVLTVTGEPGTPDLIDAAAAVEGVRPVMVAWGRSGCPR